MKKEDQITENEQLRQTPVSGSLTMTFTEFLKENVDVKDIENLLKWGIDYVSEIFTRAKSKGIDMSNISEESYPVKGIIYKDLFQFVDATISQSLYPIVGYLTIKNGIPVNYVAA